MKCALIVPSWTPDEIFSPRTAGSQINYWQPLGTLYVGASLLSANHEVRFYNGAFMTRAEILDAVADFRPDFAGIYSTAFGWRKARETAKDVKALDRSIFTCVGGPYPIAVQERCLEENGGHIDAVVTGEGERTVPEILERIGSGRDLEGVAGTAYWKGGEIVKNPPRPLIEDLDAIPFPARELLGDAAHYLPPPATYRRKPVAVLITSRGCDKRCIFCFQIDRQRKSGARGIRFRSIDNVLKEIELCVRQGYREIKFLDDTLAADYDRAMDLAREIKARRLDITWFASACVSQVDEPLLRAFKEAGCWAILLGAESGVQKNLNALRKGITLDQTRRAVWSAKEAGLKVSTPFIFGIPGETYEEGLETIQFALELDPDLANFHALTPFPGTHLHDHYEKYGTLSDELGDYTYQGAAFVPHTMTRGEISALRQTAFKRFYGRPSFILRRLLSLRSASDVKAALRGMKSLVNLWTKDGLFGRPATAVRVSRAPGGQPEVLPEQGRVQARIEEDVRDEVALVGTPAPALPDGPDRLHRPF
jgi:radical SAM superfamily enzyme YgiQ (UPF0313 family)